MQDAVRHGVEVLPADVQASGWDFRLEAGVEAQRGKSAQSAPLRMNPANRRDPTKAQRGKLAQGALRVGLRRVKGLSEEAGRRIAAAQPFRDVDDLCARAELNSRELGFLARAGALAVLSGHRHQAHWDAAGVEQPAAVWRIAEAPAPYRTEVGLAAPTVGEDMQQDYRYLGLSLGPIPCPCCAGRRRCAATARRRIWSCAAPGNWCGWPGWSPAGNGPAPPPAWSF